MNLEFFESLSADRDFCESLGRMTLAAGRFESNLRQFLILSGVSVRENDATLGPLISKLEKNGVISDNGVRVLRGLKNQRNYLAHSLFGLFSGRSRRLFFHAQIWFRWMLRSLLTRYGSLSRILRLSRRSLKSELRNCAMGFNRLHCSLLHRLEADLTIDGRRSSRKTASPLRITTLQV